MSQKKDYPLTGKYNGLDKNNKDYTSKDSMDKININTIEVKLKFKWSK